MLSIHNNLPTLTICRNLQASSRTQSSAMEKLSTGFRINKASDDPAGLILTEKLQAQIQHLEQSIRNTDESGALLGVMAGGLQQVQGILRDMDKLAIHAANNGVVSSDQVAANQAEMDNALYAINRILETTNVGGRKVLSNVSQNLFTSHEINDKPLIDTEKPPSLTVDKQLVSDYAFTITSSGEQGPEGTPLLSFDFREGDSLSSILEKLKSLDLDNLPSQGGNGSSPGGDDPDQASATMTTAELAQIRKLDEEEALKRLGTYFTTKDVSMFDGKPLLNPQTVDAGSFSTTREKTAAVPHLSTADEKLAETAEKLRNVGLGNLGTLSFGTGQLDENGEEIYGSYSLNDLYGGGKASLSRDPKLAMKIIQESSDQVAALQAEIGVTMAMQQYEKLSLENAVEKVTAMDAGIRDTDFAETTLEYSRTLILSQVGGQLLSGAMQSSRGVLDLLA